MNHPVSFELAQLLKDRGYKDKNAEGTVRLSEPKYYDDKGIIHDLGDFWEQDELQDCYNAPTIANVVMWLYEKHKIWIWVESSELPTNFYPVIDFMGIKEHDGKPSNLPSKINYKYAPEFWGDTISKAYEAAIKHVLKEFKNAIIKIKKITENG